MTCIGGLFFAVLSGQPVVIIGVTGPILLFEDSLYQVNIQSVHTLTMTHTCNQFRTKHIKQLSVAQHAALLCLFLFFVTLIETGQLM